MTKVQETWVVAPNGNRLYTRIIQPNSCLCPFKKFPAVVFVSGGLDAGALVNQGITPQGLLEVHFNVEGRGNDMPNNLRSEGAEDCNDFLHQDDLKSVVEYTLRLPNVQRNNVGIISFSYGVTMLPACLLDTPT